MFGNELDTDNFIGMKLLGFIISGDVERAKANILERYQEGKRKPNEYRGVRQDQSVFDIEVNSGLVFNADGNPIKMVFSRLSRSGGLLSLIMLDIDYFKKFNDTYGHLVGDECLQLIAAKFKTLIGRAPDVVARYGGEEFIIILPETDEKGAKIMGERLRKSVEDLAIPHGDIGHF